MLDCIQTQREGKMNNKVMIIIAAVLAIIINIAILVWAGFGIAGIINGEYTFTNILPLVLLA